MKTKINKMFTKLEETLLKTLVGKTLNKIRHDRFDNANVSFQRVTLFIKDDGAYELENRIEPTDFMWDDYGEEEVAVFKFHKVDDKGIDYKYGFNNYPKQIEMPIGESIKDIVIVEDTVKAYDKSNNKLVSEYDYVKAVIFVFADYKYCFSRGAWFSDDIVINKGDNLENKIGSIDKDWEWGEGRYSINKRTFRSLT